MKTALSLLLLSSFAIAHAQKATKPVTVVWNLNDSRCKVIYRDGHPHERINTGSMLIDVYEPGVYDKHTDMVMVGVMNTSTGDLDVDPRRFAAQADDLSHTLFLTADADKLLTKDENHRRRMQAIGAALSGFGAGMQTQTATVNNSDGSTSTATYHDPTAVQNANAAAAANSANTSSYFGRLSSSVLRRNTLSSGNFVVGYVYFEKPKRLDKHVKLGAIGIELSGTVYIFPFTAGRVPASQ